MSSELDIDVQKTDLANMSIPNRPSIKDRLQEDDLTDECRDLLLTLPRERGSVTEYIYQYEGFWVAARFLQGLIASKKHFKAQDTDIILVTTPKSGTTWLKALLFALLNRSKFLDALLTSNPHDLVPFLDTRLYFGRELPDLSAFASPRLFATHVPLGSLPKSIKNSSCKVVYLCRNPKDVFVSFWHYSNKLRPKELAANELGDLFNKFCNGVSAYGPFWDHVLGYWNESLVNPQKVLFLQYEKIQEQPVVQLRRLAEFLDCPFSAEEETKGMPDEIMKLCSFNHLSNLEVNKNDDRNQVYFREGEVGNWSEVLTPEMVARLDRITEEKMHGSGFKF